MTVCPPDHLILSLQMAHVSRSSEDAAGVGADSAPSPWSNSTDGTSMGRHVGVGGASGSMLVLVGADAAP